MYLFLEYLSLSFGVLIFGLHNQFISQNLPFPDTPNMTANATNVTNINVCNDGYPTAFLYRGYNRYFFEYYRRLPVQLVRHTHHIKKML